MSPMMRSRYVALVGLLTAVGCSGGGDDEGTTDAQPMEDAAGDAGVRDTGGPPDSGVVPDSGFDGGFADPNTVAEGYEDVQGTRTFVHVRGTVTSTLPPLIVLPTGPHQGGVSGFFGHLGGGIGHEYLPEHLDFLLPHRLMIYFDFKATGRSGFGTVGTATISVDVHVLQVAEVLDWASEKFSIDTSKVDVLGHGYGAGIGAVFAARNPSRVDRLVLLDPMGANVQQYAQAIADLQARLTSSDRTLLDTITREPDCIGDGSNCTVEVWRILAPRLGCQGNESRVNTLVFAYGELRTFDFLFRDLTNHRYDWGPILPQITADTTVISGPCDPTPAGAALTYTASIAGARHDILTGTGHWPMVEDTIEFRRSVGRALQRP